MEAEAGDQAFGRGGYLDPRIDFPLEDVLAAPDERPRHIITSRGPAGPRRTIGHPSSSSFSIIQPQGNPSRRRRRTGEEDHGGARYQQLYYSEQEQEEPQQQEVRHRHHFPLPRGEERGEHLRGRGRPSPRTMQERSGYYDRIESDQEYHYQEYQYQEYYQYRHELYPRGPTTTPATNTSPPEPRHTRHFHHYHQDEYERGYYWEDGVAQMQNDYSPEESSFRYQQQQQQQPHHFQDRSRRHVHRPSPYRPEEQEGIMLRESSPYWRQDHDEDHHYHVERGGYPYHDDEPPEETVDWVHHDSPMGPAVSVYPRGYDWRSPEQQEQHEREVGRGERLFARDRDHPHYDSEPSTITPPQQEGDNESKPGSFHEPGLPPKTEVEISPGVKVVLRGAVETKDCVRRDFFVPTKCFACELEMFCIQNAAFCLCPSCRVVHPLEGNDCTTTSSSGTTSSSCNKEKEVGNYGLGLGFTAEDLASIQQEAMK